MPRRAGKADDPTTTCAGEERPRSTTRRPTPSSTAQSSRLLVSELFGVLADVDPVSGRSGARLDPLGQDFHVTPDELHALVDRQRKHFSPKLVEQVEKDADAARKKKAETLSASKLNLGGSHPGRGPPRRVGSQTDV